MSGTTDQNNSTTLLQGSRLLYLTQDGNQSVGLNSYIDPSTNAVMGLVIFNELNDPPNQTRVSINNQGITETFANGDPEVNVSWENFYLLKQATPALRLPATTDILVVNDTFEANDNNLAKTRIARMSADASANPLVSLNIVATGETATLTQNGLTYLPTTAGTPTTRTWAEILASSGSTNTLNQVLINGNTATGASANIGLTTNSVGGLTAPQLTLNNNNTSATLNVGFPTCELYKSGRNAQTQETLGSVSFYGNDGGGQKTEFGRLQVKTENIASGNEDGTIQIFSSVNGVISEVFNFNGATNDNNSFRPLDLNGNGLNTTSGNLAISATASSGTGTINIGAKTGAVINLDSNVVMDNSETLFIRNGANTLSNTLDNSQMLLNNNTDPTNVKQNYLTNALHTLLLNQPTTAFYNEGTPQSIILRESDNTTSQDTQKTTLTRSLLEVRNVGFDGRYSQFTAGAMTIQAPYSPDPVQTGFNAITAETQGSNTGSGYIILNSGENNTGTGRRQQTQLVNGDSGGQLNLNWWDASNLMKSFRMFLQGVGGGFLQFDNAVDTNPLTIQSVKTDLDLVSNGGGITISTASSTGSGDIAITGKGGSITTLTAGLINLNSTGGGAVNLNSSGDVGITPNTSTGNIVFTGANLQSNSSGSNSGEHLVIVLNGNTYKIELKNP